ncbi:MAG: biotin/lipoyl-binding protein [Acidimicrobiales bacterium]|nr:biotin/lipoyl-binding protein [Acidimicrobiales bacterium]
MIDLRIPKPGDAIEAGTIIEWRVADGDTVSVGQVLYVLETEKTEMEIESPAAGILRIEADPGEELPVGTVIGTIE